MPELRLSDDLQELRKADVVVVPFFQDDAGVRPAGRTLLGDADGANRAAAALRRGRRFTGAVGEIADCLLLGDEDGGCDLVAVGLGREADLDLDVLRTAAQTSAHATRGRGLTVTSLAELGGDRAGAVRAVIEGTRFGRHRTFGAMASIPAETVVAMVPAGVAATADVRRAFALADVAGRHAGWVRRLVDTPPRELTPAILAEIIAERARRLGIAVEVWEGEALAVHGFGGTAAVGAGSVNTPRVVVLRTPTHPGRKPLGLAGKGITFDSGGINLKRDLAEIFRMKDDMAGAAAVAGALFAAVELGAAPDVVAVLPMAENMPGATAQRPGDILTHPGGMRTEVVDTDCEGRLILADAIAFLAQSDVEGIVDVGTLTDGGGVGPLLWGCWATDDALAASILAAGAAAGEPGWRLPLRSEYRVFLESRVADIANAPLSVPDIGLTAATYLRAFVGDTPWVHVDNGASAYLEREIGGWRAGPTASPMRALLQLLLDRSRS